MNSISKIRVYTNGVEEEGTGAYAYIVLENKDCGTVKIEDGGGRIFSPSLLRAKFAQAGATTDEMRMKMRAVYEGIRHCPDGSNVEVYTDNFLIETTMRTSTRDMVDGDIADKYRRYIEEHRIHPTYFATKVYYKNDLPANNHDEWTWWARFLCEYAIKKYNKENKK